MLSPSNLLCVQALDVATSPAIPMTHGVFEVLLQSGTGVRTIPLNVFPSNVPVYH